MKVANKPEAGEPGGEKNQVFSELFRLQSEFQMRLADETLRYLRRLQGTAAPAAPGTVVIPMGTDELKASGQPGSTVEVKLDIENLQRVHSSATPMISPLASASGVTWHPEADFTPMSFVLPPDAVQELRIRIHIPEGLPAGWYRGCLTLHGFREGALPLMIEAVRAEPVAAAAPAPRRPAVKKAAKKSAKKAAPRRRS
ncbi:MAG: hypothetical protein ACKV2U_17315 [Bryobacteraceae bacterium]